MHTILIEKLRAYIVNNNPDLLIKLQDSFSVTQYLEDKVQAALPLAEQLFSENKPLYVVEELCLERMTEDLRPSKYLYIRELLEEEFLQHYSRFRQAGVLTYEIINMIDACQSIFEVLGFSEENRDNRQLHYAVTGTIGTYLEEQ